jgi:hypothetical protein
MRIFHGFRGVSLRYLDTNEKSLFSGEELWEEVI